MSVPRGCLIWAFAAAALVTSTTAMPQSGANGGHLTDSAAAQKRVEQEGVGWYPTGNGWAVRYVVSNDPERNARLKELDARIRDEFSGKYFRAIIIEGNLGKVDIEIDHNDQNQIESELRRYLGTIEDFVGPVDGLEFSNIRARRWRSQLNQSDSNVIGWDFEQAIRGISVTSNKIFLKGEEVSRVEAQFVDPDQPNTDPALWQEEELLKVYAAQELSRVALPKIASHTDITQIEPEDLAGPEISFEYGDSEGTLFPYFSYSHPHTSWVATVNAIDLSVRVANRVSH